MGSRERYTSRRPRTAFAGEGRIAARTARGSERGAAKRLLIQGGTAAPRQFRSISRSVLGGTNEDR